MVSHGELTQELSDILKYFKFKFKHKDKTRDKISEMGALNEGSKV